ncbi:chitinase-3-like protein 2 isoform X3 [Rhodnius prolixus]|uniref:chitinase-3-like protein 2 isoform X3 n=1 Tax=Rhodnius prolixus TaxID=13249 RepID=UPI003D189623
MLRINVSFDELKFLKTIIFIDLSVMVLKYSETQGNYNELLVTSDVKKSGFIFVGLLIFVTVWFLSNSIFWTYLKLERREAFKDGSFLWHNNYDELQKIYKERLSKNLTWSSGHGVNSDQNVMANPFRIVCYYVTPSNLTRSRDLPPNSVDPYLCTHIIIGFAIIQNATIQTRSPTDIQIYKTIVNLKNVNPQLKVLISVEDFSSDGEFAKMVSSDELRTKFATNTLIFLNSTGFDGVDLDWEFPSWPNADLIQVEFVNLMSYDYHLYSQYLPLTGPNAPLYQRNAEEGYMETLNTNWSATHWVEWGMPWTKINVGIPTFGHSFRLINEDNNGWNAPASGIGKEGKGDGFVSYPEACKFIQNPSTTHVFDEEYEVPYAYNGKEWISYDSPVSVELKARYVKNNKFGGAMIYSLNCDDFEGVCSSIKFPLTRIVSNILMKD